MKQKTVLALALFLMIFTAFSYAQSNQSTIVNDDLEEGIGGDDPDSTDFSLSLFTDSIHWNMLPDSVRRMWSNDVIHSRKYDFTTKTDTTVIILQDNINKCYVHPFCGYITSNFGHRKYRFHNGIDIKLQIGDPVQAAFDGIVRVTKRSKGYGNVIVINHLNGLETTYGHLSKIDVVPNQVVKAGDIIGKGGNTGRSTGSHLHFEIRYYDEPMDPNDIINFKTYSLHNDTLLLSKKQFEYLVELRKVKYHTIRSGDTLGKIAMKYGTSVKQLCALNHMTTKTILRVGRTIRYQ